MTRNTLIENQYKIYIPEYVTATMDFISARPIIKIFFWLMKLGFVFLLFGFFLKNYTNQATSYDLIIIIFTASFILFNKRVNIYLLTKKLIKANMNDVANTVHITKYNLNWSSSNDQRFQIRVKDIPKVFNNQDGYMIPITGLQGAGKFIWVPKRGFIHGDEQVFLDLLKDLAIKVVKVGDARKH